MVQFSVSRPALEINAANDNAPYFRGLAYFSKSLLAYFSKSLYDRAVADFTKSMELDPTLADGYSNKTLALEAVGRPAEAREAYGPFLRYAPPEAKDQIEQARSKVGRR